jgi:hypothetical protein
VLLVLGIYDPAYRQQYDMIHGLDITISILFILEYNNNADRFGRLSPGLQICRLLILEANDVI